ncbi:MAG: GNAT family N-acetyltransferase [Lachnospiraceae bacterium]|nr:GNAT family N-acetyltransferase [Lachnospiraceae bacterium]
MEIKEYTHYNEQEVLPLYAAVGWSAYTRDPAALKEGFAHSLLTLAAYDNGELLGLIRTVGDGSTIVFIQDLLVYPEHQRQGIGKALLEEVLARFANVRQIELVTDDRPQTVAFYQSLEFTELSQLGCRGFMRVKK